MGEEKDMKKWILVFLAIWTSCQCVGCGQEEKGETITKTNIIQEETGEGEIEDVEESDETKTGLETTTENELETLYGDVETLGEGEFILNKADVGDDVVALNLIDKTLITVKYTEKTRWIVKRVKNSGINPETDVTSAEGGEENLEMKQSVKIQGSYSEDIFVANEIEISIFEN